MPPKPPTAPWRLDQIVWRSLESPRQPPPSARPKSKNPICRSCRVPNEWQRRRVQEAFWKLSVVLLQKSTWSTCHAGSCPIHKSVFLNDSRAFFASGAHEESCLLAAGFLTDKEKCERPALIMWPCRIRKIGAAKKSPSMIFYAHVHILHQTCHCPSSSSRTLGPVKGCRLHGGLTSVAQLLLPARVDLVGILLEGQECALDLLMGLGILDHSIAQADVAELASLPLLPGLLTLTAGDGTNLGTVLAKGHCALRPSDETCPCSLNTLLKNNHLQIPSSKSINLTIKIT